MSESEQSVSHADLSVHAFRKSVPMQVTLQEILKAVVNLTVKAVSRLVARTQ